MTAIEKARLRKAKLLGAAVVDSSDFTDGPSVDLSAEAVVAPGATVEDLSVLGKTVTTVAKSASKKKNDILNSLAKDMNKMFKAEVVVRVDPEAEKDLSQGCYSTGYQAIDDLITGKTDEEGRTIAGSGQGFPKGRVVEVFGPESCLRGDTFVQYEIRTATGGRQNHKGGTLRRLYEVFHNVNAKGKGKYLRDSARRSSYYLASANDEDRIFQNRIVDVVRTGVKPCFKLTTARGHVLVGTSEHKVYTGERFVKLGSLAYGDTVGVHEHTPFEVEELKETSKGRVYLYVKSHPVAGTKLVNGRYTYKRLARARAVVEAHINGLSLEQYVEKLNACELGGLEFLRREQPVHHANEDFTDDRLDNLIVLTGSEHNRSHALNNHNNLGFVVTEDTVESIEPVGEFETYDIKMLSPYNNYVANGIVVHNCGKTSMALMVVADCQRKGGIAAYIDAEHALDFDYARSLGVVVEDLLVCKPDAGEDALELIKQLIKRKVDVVVLDSVAALVPRSELASVEGGKIQPGIQARMMSQALKRITVLLNKGGPLVFFINQIRYKIGVMFGNPETTSGGNALKFYASVRCDLRIVKRLKESSRTVGVCIRARTVKNKVAPPFREVWYYILFNKGVVVPSKAEVNSLFKKQVDKAAKEDED